MKATFNIPDELYRQVKAKSALEGTPVKDVVVQLFQTWLEAPQAKSPRRRTKWTKFQPPLKHLVPGEVKDHSMDAVRESIAKNFNESL